MACHDVMKKSKYFPAKFLKTIIRVVICLLVLHVFIRLYYAYCDGKGPFLRHKIGTGYFEPNTVFDIVFSSDSKYLFIPSNHGTVLAWCLEKNTLDAHVIFPLSKKERIVNITQAKSLIGISTCEFNDSHIYRLYLHETETGRTYLSNQIDAKIIDLEFDNNQQYLVFSSVASENNNRLHDTRNANICYHTWNHQNNSIELTSWKPKQTSILSCYHDPNSKVSAMFNDGSYVKSDMFNFADKCSLELHKLYFSPKSEKLHDYQINAISISHNQKYIASLSSPDTPISDISTLLFHYGIFPRKYMSELIVWDADNLAPLYRIKRSNFPAYKVIFSPDDEWLAATFGGYVYVFRSSDIIM